MTSPCIRTLAKHFSFTAIVIGLTLVMAGYVQAQTAVNKSQPSPSAQLKTERASEMSTQSIEQALDADGRLKADAVGSFDTRGFRMTLGPNKEPVFLKESMDARDGGMGGPAAEAWGGQFRVNGSNGQIHAMATDSEGNLYVGGDFTAIGDVAANYVAKWDGTSWSALGVGVGTGNNSIRAIAVVGNSVYVGGQFNPFVGVGAPGFNIGRWDTTTETWSNLSNGISGFVYAMATDGTNLYVGGSFTGTAGGSDPVVSMANIGKWNGTSWSAMGTGTNNPILALAISGTTLYVGGQFTTAGGVSSNRIAKVDVTTNTWSALGTGVNDQVTALAASGSDLYAGGIFTTAGGVTGTNKFAKWNDATSTWSAVGNGTNNTILSIAISGSDVYIAGSFTAVSGSSIPAQRIAKWNGTAWSAPDPGLNNGARALAIVGSDVYIGGFFTTAGGLGAKNIARWDGSSTWTSSPGIDGTVSAINVGPNDNGQREVYIGGTFTQVGGIAANNVAKWTRFGWLAMGAGVNGQVRALASRTDFITGTEVYVGGSFTEAGGASANNIAKWSENTQSWSALGSGMGGPGLVLTIAIDGFSGTDVYVGGFFTTAGGVAANYIAKWDGNTSTWSAMGSGMDNIVYAIAVNGSNVFAGGSFSTAGGISASNIARWNGSTWSAMGSGMDNPVFALATSGTNLYAGGFFSTAGGISASNIAVWNGSTWSALGSGLPGGTVNSITTSGNLVYVGGAFTVTGGAPGNRVAVWNSSTSTWSTLGSGVNSDVSAIGVRGQAVFIGGGFTLAGGRPSGAFGQYFSNSFTGAFDNDWSNPANWSAGVVPNDAIINGINATISGFTQVGDLQVNAGNKITIAAGQTLQVFGTFTLEGEIDGDGTIELRNAGDGVFTRLGTGCIRTTFGREVGFGFAEQSYLYPVGRMVGCAPLELTATDKAATIVFVRAEDGAYTDPATGLPTNRLSRWWNVFDGCGEALTEGPAGCFAASSGTITLNYLPGEIPSGSPSAYKAWSISGGSASLLGGVSDTVRRSVTFSFASGLNFNDLTLAQVTTTAAPAVIAGRVLDSNGRPVANASVLMTKPNGETVTVKTNSFGKYMFSGMTAGETYVVMAQTRQHLYMPKVVSLSDDLTDLDFRP